MITEKVSIILEDKNIYYPLICKVINIVTNRDKNKFNIEDLTSLNEFTFKEKQYLRKIFSDDISELYIWEHSFCFENNLWKYDESQKYDYSKTIKNIFLLLNTRATSIGEKFNSDDYQLIKNLWHGWLNLLDYETRLVLYECHYFDEKEFIEFVSHKLKSRFGDSCIFNFEFLKAFMEAKHDYHTKKALEAILGIENYAN